MKQDTNIGSNILRVSASDEDADNNGAIRYSLTAPNDPADLDYFDIQPESGWIFLQKPLDVSAEIYLHLTCPNLNRMWGLNCFESASRTTSNSPSKHPIKP